MQIGDVLFYKGTSFISRVISWVTKSPYTHVALVIGDGMILEAQRFTKTSIRMLAPSEVYEAYRIPELTLKEKERIYMLALTLRGREYDYLSMVSLIIRAILGKKHTYFEDINKDFCSEVIDNILYASGVHRWNKVAVGDVYPHELLQVYNLRKLYAENHTTRDE